MKRDLAWFRKCAARRSQYPPTSLKATRHTTREFIQFVSHAEGSLAELDTQLKLGVELGYCGDSEAAPIGTLMEEVRKMLNGLRRNLSARER